MEVIPEGFKHRPADFKTGTCHVAADHEVALFKEDVGGRFGVELVPECFGAAGGLAEDFPVVANELVATWGLCGVRALGRYRFSFWDDLDCSVYRDC